MPATGVALLRLVDGLRAFDTESWGRPTAAPAGGVATVGGGGVAGCG